MKPNLIPRPSGQLCACECGQETIRYNSVTRRFIAGHHNRGKFNPRYKGGRQKAGKYIYLVSPNHARANKRGQVKEHIIVAEHLLGRSLTMQEVVHHIDGNGQNNRPTNLRVMTRGEHSRLHLTGAEFPQYSRKELLDHLAHLLPISVTTYRIRFKKPSHETYRYRFGSWSKAKLLAAKYK